MKQILIEKNVSLDDAARWHYQIILSVCDLHIVGEGMANRLKEFMQFRHFFVHSYKIDLDFDRIRELSRLSLVVFPEFFEELNSYF